MSAKPILAVTVVNHLATDIAASSDLVWADIVETFVEARHWRAEGYAVDPIDDPAAPIGGYRMRLDRDGASADERIVHVTERDEAARRLSLFVDFRSAPGGVLVHATYHARATPEGARYTIDCHTRMGIDPPADGAVAAAIDGLAGHFGSYLTGYLGRVKARVEGQDHKEGGDDDAL